MSKKLAIYHLIAIAGVLVFTFFSNVQADYEQALAAYNRGDREAAFKEWRYLAEQGDARCQYEVGLMYDSGEGAPKDYMEAMKWYRKAAEQEEGSAQNNLGLMYSEGRGVLKDDNEAVKWYYRAARHGSLAGIFHLALSYEKGRGVPQDYNVAAITYLEAAKRGYAPAQANVGLLYAKGVTGVPQDYSLAYKWISLAIPNLSGETKTRFIKHRDAVVIHLSPAERDRMDQVIRDWKPILPAPKNNVPDVNATAPNATPSSSVSPAR
jgi:hypothetical protein